ncbi:hypothetical protein [Kistimonas asteriae]|uniref:hypothetical protein n=1 Tax=Kistimonas asteriae TaxID=517724 RepID=UPI001BAB3082|nr:hypothetical protein [Kistimonas asteriae]
MSIDALNSGSVNTAGLDGSDKAGNGRPVSPFNHSQLGSGKALINPGLFPNAGDVQDLMESMNIRKMMPSSNKKDDKTEDDDKEDISKALETLKKITEIKEVNLSPEQLTDLLREFKSLEKNSELNESAIKRALEGMPGQDQYEALGLIIESFRESDSDALANNLANTPVIDHNGQSVTFSEMRNGLQGSISRVVDFQTLADALQHIHDEMKAAGGFYETVLAGIDWLRAGLVVEMAMMEGSGSVSSLGDAGKPTAQVAEKLFLSGNTDGALSLIHRISDRNELLRLQDEIKQVPPNTPHLATVLAVIEERLNLLQPEAAKKSSGRSAWKG